jgi:hypothetical protein
MTSVNLEHTILRFVRAHCSWKFHVRSSCKWPRECKNESYYPKLNSSYDGHPSQTSSQKRTDFGGMGENKRKETHIHQGGNTCRKSQTLTTSSTVDPPRSTERSILFIFAPRCVTNSGFGHTRSPRAIYRKKKGRNNGGKHLQSEGQTRGESWVRVITHTVTIIVTLDPGSCRTAF